LLSVGFGVAGCFPRGRGGSVPGSIFLFFLTFAGDGFFTFPLSFFPGSTLVARIRAEVKGWVWKGLNWFKNLGFFSCLVGFQVLVSHTRHRFVGWFLFLFFFFCFPGTAVFVFFWGNSGPGGPPSCFFFLSSSRREPGVGEHMFFPAWMELVGFFCVKPVASGTSVFGLLGLGCFLPANVFFFPWVFLFPICRFCPPRCCHPWATYMGGDLLLWLVTFLFHPLFVGSLYRLYSPTCIAPATPHLEEISRARLVGNRGNGFHFHFSFFLVRGFPNGGNPPERRFLVFPLVPPPGGPGVSNETLPPPTY